MTYESDTRKQVRRRAAGEDSIYQRASDYRWIVEIRDGVKPDGRPNIRYLTAKGYPDDTRENKKLNTEARNALLARRDEAKAKLRTGLGLDRDRLTVGSWLDMWLEVYVKPNKRITTFQGYESVCRVHLKPAIGRKQLRLLQPIDVQELLNRMSERNISPTTIKNARAVLRKALNDAMKQGNLVMRNVATLTTLPDQKKFVASPLKHDEIPLFLEAAKDDRLSALWQTFLMTGMRAGEAYGLRWRDVDLEHQQLTISVQMLRVNRNRGDASQVSRKRAEFGPPKTGSSEATIPIPPQLVQALREHQERQDIERLVAGERWKGDEWQQLVFCTTIGTPLDPTNTLRAFRSVLEEAGLDTDIRIHDLRHTAGTMLARLGVHPRVAQQILRHAQLSTTMAVYTHVEDDTLRQSIDMLGGLVAPEMEKNRSKSDEL